MTAYSGVTFDTETGMEITLGQVLGIPEADARQKAYAAAQAFFDTVGYRDENRVSIPQNSKENPNFYLQDGEVMLILQSQLVPTGLMCTLE